MERVQKYVNMSLDVNDSGKEMDTYSIRWRIGVVMEKDLNRVEIITVGN